MLASTTVLNMKFSTQKDGLKNYFQKNVCIKYIYNVEDAHHPQFSCSRLILAEKRVNHSRSGELSKICLAI